MKWYNIFELGAMILYSIKKKRKFSQKRKESKMKEKRKRKAQKFLMLLLMSAMLVAMPESLVRAETAERQMTERELPKNPAHHCTKKDDGTDMTDWSYVYFN